MKVNLKNLRIFITFGLLAGTFAFFTLSAVANINLLYTDNNKDKVRKTDSAHFILNAAVPKTKFGVDAGYRYTGALSSDFRFSNANNTNVLSFKTIMTYTKGNVTFVVPYNVQVQQQLPGNMNFQKLQIILPLKKG